MTKRAVLISTVAGLAAIAALAIWAGAQPEPLIVQGEVEATRVDVAPLVAGEIAQVHVAEGATVAAGDALVTLQSPQLEAGLQAAEASAAVARADQARIGSTRPETIAVREAELAKAQADLVLAQHSYDRLVALTERSVASQTQFENAENALTAARAALAATEANLTLTRNGASPEERAVAAAQTAKAEAALNQIRVDVAQLAVTAPISGEVVSRVAEAGQLAGAGAPLLSIVDLSDVWFTFNLREDLLGGLAIGDRITVDLPALRQTGIAAQISAISALGSYANWRATRATGDFDLRTFQIRARPLGPVTGIRPGMSAIFEQARDAAQR